VSIRVPRPLLKELDALAKESKRSRSNLIVWVLETYLSQTKAVKTDRRDVDAPRRS